MWFSVYDYPKFATRVSLSASWEEDFNQAGFKTYRFDSNGDFMGKRHWLDDYEFTWFLLRYG